MDPFKVYKQLLENYLHKEIIPLLEQAWNEPHRYWHNKNHLEKVIECIDKNRFNLNTFNYDALILASFFHDCYYNPRENKNNEDESIKRFLSSYDNKDINLRNLVVEMINATRYRKVPQQYIIKLFWEADNNIFYESYDNLLKWEQLIKKENQHVFESIYKKKRIEFLKTNLGLFNKIVDENLEKLIKYVKEKY